MAYQLKLSNYVQSLSNDVKLNYINILQNLNIKTDPYLLSEVDSKFSWLKLSVDNFQTLESYPAIDNIEIFKYFVLKTSLYTENEVKAYKSLDAYNYLISGHVCNVHWLRSNNLYITLAEVSHSQRTGEDGLKVWLIANNTGEIYSGHCKCVAGNAKTCSHIAAVCYYFYVYGEVQKQKKNVAVTDVTALWVQPGKTPVTGETLKKIDFTHVKKKLKVLCDRGTENLPPTPKVNHVVKRRALFGKENCYVGNDGSATHVGSTQTRLRRSKLRLPEKIVKLHNDPVVKELWEENCPNPVFYLIPPYVNELASQRGNFPECYEKLYSSDNDGKSLEELITLGGTFNFAITDDMIKIIEQETRDQSDNPKWFSYRAGRITASKIYDVCHVKSLSSNISLIQNICYPEKKKFHSVATDWGCKHEKKAIGLYLQNQAHHLKLQFKKCGLFLHKQWPFIGASPDGLVNCECCGCGGVEVKCPLCLNTRNVGDLQYLTDDSGQICLIQDHTYYYQMITQMECANLLYCDFVVWSPHEEMHIERIYPNKNVWKVLVCKSLYFFKNAVLPELLSRFYSINAKNIQVPIAGPSPFCICKTNMSGKMVICGREGCPIVMYHMKCIGLKRKPKKFICNTCNPKQPALLPMLLSPIT